MTNQFNCAKLRVKLCVNSWLKNVYIFVDFSTISHYPHFSTPLFIIFHHPFHPLLNNLSLSSPTKTFPLFHKPYYYYNNFIK